MASCPFDSKQFCTTSDGRYCYNEHLCTEGYREVIINKKKK